MAGRKLSQEKWDEIKYQYAISNLSVREISNRHKIPISTVAKRCQSDHWTQARKEYRKKAYESAIDEAAGKESSKLAVLMKASDKLDDMIKKICIMMDDSELTIRDIKDLTSAIKDAIAIKRDLWSIPKEPTEGSDVVYRFDNSEDEDLAK